MGAGPAGLTLGCYLADAGVPCLIFERSNHPRPHVGESLMPATVRVLREIGFLDVLDAADFPRSQGVAYHTSERKQVEVAYAEFPQEGVDRDYSYHVDRAKFDMLLMKHAEAAGCDIVQGALVREVLFDEDGRARGVRVVVGSETVDVPARVVVDAGGRATRLGRQLGIRQEHAVFDQFALHAWFTGVDRGKRRTESYTHIYFIPELRGWAWQAPIHPEITSIGLVAAKTAFQESGRDIHDFFPWALGLNRHLAKATANAQRINEVKGETNYSYRLEQVSGDGWLAIGDAARFIDPVFSSGVSIGIHGARAAAEAITGALRADDVGRAAFADYEEKLMSEAAIWDDFIRLFYRLLPSFTHLLDDVEYRERMLRMIQGEIDAGSEPEVLEAMRELVRTVEAADEHPWRDELLELPTG